MLTWPLADHIITRDFYYPSSLYVGGQHAALDLIRAEEATRASPILVVADGVVVGVGWDFYSGFFVAVDHAGGWRSIYRHMYGQSPVVVGQQVSQGQVIGNVGNTGWSGGDHLHFDLWSTNPIDGAFEKNGIWAVDPELYLGQEEDSMLTPEQEAKLLNDVEGLRANQTRLGNWVDELRAQVASLQTGGVSEAQARAIAQEEDNKLKVTK